MNNGVLFSLTMGIVLSAGAPRVVADEPDFSGVSVEREDIGRFKGMRLSTERRCRFSRGDWYELELIVRWLRNDAIEGQSVLYSGMSTTCPSVRIAGDELLFSMPGTRYDAEGSRTAFFFRWRGTGIGFVEVRTEKTDPWEENMRQYRKCLSRGDWACAVSMAVRMGITPNAGHSSAAEEMTQVFFSAFCDQVEKLHRQGKKQQAADLAMMLLFSPPKILFEECVSDNMDWSWPHWASGSRAFCIARTDENTAKLTRLVQRVENQSNSASWNDRERLFELRALAQSLVSQRQKP